MTVNASHLGGPFPITGTITFQPTLLDGTAASATIAGGYGVMAKQPLTAPVTRGAFTLPDVLDTSASNPVNVCYKVTVTTNNRLQSLGPGYECVQPAANKAPWCSSGICNFDVYLPSVAALAPAVAGAKGDTGATGLPGPAGNTLAGTTSPEAYAASQGVTIVPGTTDEAPFLQQCVNNHLYQCILQKRDYYLGSTLVLPDLAYLRGSGMTNGTRIFSHVNGPAITMAPGPNQGMNVGGFNLVLDPTLANGQGIVLNAQQSSSYAGGGAWNSSFDHIEIDGCALECVLTSTSGQAATINQFVTWNDITIQGPSQSHPAALWKSIGPNNQFDRYKVAVNGDNNNAHYPNALEQMTYDSASSAPSDIGCFKCTYQGGAIGIKLLLTRTYSQLAGYVENVGTAINAQTSYGVQFDFMDVRNSGYVNGVMTASGGVTGSFLHNTMDASATATQPVYGLACTNSNQMEDGYNTTNIGNAESNGCGEQQALAAASLTVFGTVALITGDGGATPITTVNAPQLGAGKTVTLKASGNSIALGAGGNIDFQGFPFPLLVPSGTSVTLRKDDLLQRMTLQSTTAALPVGLVNYVNTGQTHNYFTASVVATGTGSTAGLAAGDLCTIQYRWTGSGATYSEFASCLSANGTVNLYTSAGKALGSESFARVGGYNPPS